ncbi:hypothetical protein PCK1_003152 [Pneumocystis canis]|nr:hypothetical protein PCK1_003152 [Pneumocystis canis]
MRKMTRNTLSAECNTEPVKGESRIRRALISMNGLISTPLQEIKTVYDILLKAVKDYGSKRALGSRKILQLHVEEKMLVRMVNGKEKKVKKDWTYYELSDYEYINFKELSEKTHILGSGFRALGLSKNDRVAIYAATSAAWLITAFSCITQSLTIVAVYDTLKEGFVFSFIETEVKAVFSDANLLSNFINYIENIPSLKIIIYYGEPEKETIDCIAKKVEGIKIISYEELISLGKENPVDPVPPSPDDLLCIMYTSGSTNIPKGVTITHKNVVAAVSGIVYGIGSYIKEDFTVLSYLPLAHIYEFVFEMFCIYYGITIGYGSIKTLSDISCRNCKGDIQTFKPSIMTGVPAVWENVRKVIIQKLNSISKFKRCIFWFAYNIKSRFLQYPFPGLGILDALVFKSIRVFMGGNIRVIFNGGASISPDTQKFLSTVICPMLTGYGLTETCATCTIMSPGHFSLGNVGHVSPAIEIKLVDVPDAGYFTSSIPQQGEIWLRGDSISQGYYNRDEENKEAYDDDFWFKTGDIGEWTKNGELKIIDRKKNLVKTQNGEYIALEKVYWYSFSLNRCTNVNKLESVYRSCNIISNICVYADPNRVRPVAIVVPSEVYLKKYLDSKGVLFEDDDLAVLCRKEEVRSLILNELSKLAKQNNFAKIEVLQNIILTHEEFTIQNGLLTAAQKFQRKKIFAKYEKEIISAYEIS